MHALRGCCLLALACSACGRTGLPIDDGDGGYGGGAFDGFDDAYEEGGGGGRRGGQSCREVDVLFVMDDSGSMAAYQTNVLSNYDVFIDGLQESIESIERMHIGVTTAEAYPYNTRGCQTLGSLVVRTDGPQSSAAQCGPYSSGRNYMTAGDDLDTAFRCAAQVGTGGSDLDTPLAAALAAISPPLTDPGGCNEGFFTPGALLVLVIITDTYPNAFGVTDLDPWFSATSIAARVGSYEDVVVVSIASTEESPCLNPLLPGIEEFSSAFDYAYVGAICETDYSRVFSPAVDVIRSACPS